MERKPISVAIDGPAGAGKSTIAKAASKLLGFIYVDTGAVYRACAYACTRDGISPDDEVSVRTKLSTVVPSLEFIDGAQHILINHEDVTDRIRTPEISAVTSKFAALPCVRDFLLELQRDIALRQNVIMDGRDIGTVVLPNADVKIFLTASPEERARRRCKELTEKGEDVSFDEILRAINERDEADRSREIAPLKQAEDAVLLDTSDMDAQQAVNAVAALITERCSL